MMIVAEKQRHIHSELLPNLSSFINHSAFRGENQQRATNRRHVPCRLGASSASNLQSISTRVEFLIMGRFQTRPYRVWPRFEDRPCSHDGSKSGLNSAKRQSFALQIRVSEMAACSARKTKWDCGSALSGARFGDSACSIPFDRHSPDEATGVNIFISAASPLASRGFYKQFKSGLCYCRRPSCSQRALGRSAMEKQLQ